jgi:hypothetical protein
LNRSGNEISKSTPGTLPNNELEDALEYQGAETTRNMSRGETLRNKYSNLSREDRLARIDELAESQARRNFVDEASWKSSTSNCKPPLISTNHNWSFTELCFVKYSLGGMPPSESCGR